jgi:predicted phage terminase large subunit-like protein
MIERLRLLEPEPELTGDKVDAYAEGHYAIARDSFHYFRYLIDPTLKPCWWQDHAALALQGFYDDVMRGQRPKLLLGAPPQHGKSRLLRDYACWVAGKNPDCKEMFASYSDELGIESNIHMQRMLQSPCYKGIFPNTCLAEGRELYRRTSDVLEFMHHKGSFRNTTVQGAINGFGLDVGIIDDPIKGQAESRSKTVRDRTWDWLINDFFLRFSDGAGLVMIQTRWHVDDPTGRWLDKFPDTTLLSYPAIADADDWSVKAGYRKAGEPLFEQHKSYDFLMERKAAQTQASWLSLYQQSPIIVGGGIIPIDKLRLVPVAPDRNAIKRSVRYVDKAGTHGGGAHTAMVLMSMLDDGRFIIEDVVRGQWSALEREQTLLRVAQADKMCHPRHYEVIVEQEPGSGGKESAESTIRNLRGFRVFADKVTGAKETRAEPFAAQVQGSNVWLLAGRWNSDFIDEAEAWPNGRYRDQIDACSGAFNRLTGRPVYNLEAMAN